MFTVLNLVEALCLNLIGQRQASVSTADQPKALLEHGKNWSLGPNFDHFAQSEGRFQTKGEIRPNEIRKPMYEQT